MTTPEYLASVRPSNLRIGVVVIDRDRESVLLAITHPDMWETAKTVTFFWN